MIVRWQDFIEERKGSMGGKPKFKGTRLTVDFVLRQLATGMTPQAMLEQYPTLKHEHLTAALLFAAELVAMRMGESERRHRPAANRP